MQDVLQSNYKVSSMVLPFVANGFIKHEGVISIGNPAYDFIYVASGEPHKNHQNLIKSWVKLAAKNIRPSLCLTLNEKRSPELLTWIEREKKEHRLNVYNVGHIPESEMMAQYMEAKALIFPSTLESFGLPLIEAKSAGLAIVASELDYIRDVVDPDESFDPNSPVSIARAVERFLGKKECSLTPLDASYFLKYLFSE
jgi:glycosyltransferase involved in cell wall biosynthesis